jgi:Protein of unknown function (DUF2274)
MKHLNSVSIKPAAAQLTDHLGAWDGALGNHSWISVAYAEALARETGQTIVDPAKLVAPMLTRFMATDRAFKSRRMRQPTSAGDG